MSERVEFENGDANAASASDWERKTSQNGMLPVFERLVKQLSDEPAMFRRPVCRPRDAGEACYRSRRASPFAKHCPLWIGEITAPQSGTGGQRKATPNGRGRPVSYPIGIKLRK